MVQDITFGAEGFAGIRVLCVGADEVLLEFTCFPFVALKTCPVRYRHLEWGEDGEKISALQPVEPDLVVTGVGREESAFMIAEEIGGKNPCHSSQCLPEGWHLAQGGGGYCRG